MTMLVFSFKYAAHYNEFVNVKLEDWVREYKGYIFDEACYDSFTGVDSDDTLVKEILQLDKKLNADMIFSASRVQGEGFKFYGMQLRRKHDDLLLYALFDDELEALQFKLTIS
jgi:hypothetical protein